MGDVAQHPGHGIVFGPRKDPERGRVGAGQHVGLLHAGEPFHRRAVEPDPLAEPFLQLLDGDGERLQESQDVREPQPHEPDTPVLGLAQGPLGCRVHGSIVGRRKRAGQVPGRMPKKIPISGRNGPRNGELFVQMHKS
jgi:hypothetical protein